MSWGLQKGVTELSVKLETYMGYGKGEETLTSSWVELGVKKKFMAKKTDITKFTVPYAPHLPSC